jgi:hypothetical protein
MNQARYRSLVLLTFTLCFTSAFIDILVPGLLSLELAEAQKVIYSASSGGGHGLANLLAWVASIAMPIAMLGLWRFSVWGPKFGVLATLLLVAANAMLGGIAVSGVAFAIHTFSWLTWGAALLVPFLNPYSSWFKHSTHTAAVSV